MHTAHHIYERCITGELLQGRTVILVTHHIALCLPKASYLIELSGGQVAHQGTVEDMRLAGHLGDVDEESPSNETAIDSPVSTATPVNEADLIPASDEHIRKSRSLKGKLVEAEARAEGRVRLSTYLTYLRASGWFTWVLTLLLMLFIRAITIGNQVRNCYLIRAYGSWILIYPYFLQMFLAQWGQAYGNESSIVVPILEPLPPPAVNVKPWLLIFFIISLTGGFSTLFYIGLGYYASIRASRKLFFAMLFRLCRAPIRFFDMTPLGRVLNRFVSDFGTVDGEINIPAELRGFFYDKLTCA
jgi:ABC transporter transmembrane region